MINLVVITCVQQRAKSNTLSQTPNIALSNICVARQAGGTEEPDDRISPKSRKDEHCNPPKWLRPRPNAGENTHNGTDILSNTSEHTGRKK